MSSKCSSGSKLRAWTSPLRMNITVLPRSPFLKRYSPLLKTRIWLWLLVLWFIMGSVLKLSMRMFFRSAILTHELPSTVFMSNLFSGFFSSIPFRRAITLSGRALWYSISRPSEISL